MGLEVASIQLSDRIAYSKDYSIEGITGDYTPDMVVKPSSKEEVAEIVRLANEYDTPIYSWGGGTGVSAGCLAIEGGIVLDMKGINKVVVDTENLCVTAGAGATLDKVYREVEKSGLFFPHHTEPAVSATVGGTLSTMGVSKFTAKYGYAYDQVLALEVVLGTGEIMRIGGKSYLSLPSHNLINLFLGAEGTLGVITEATLKIYPTPTFRSRFSIGFKSLKHAVETCLMIQKAGITPETIYMFDYVFLARYLTRLGVEPPKGITWAALFGFSGDEEIVKFQLDATLKLCSKSGAERLPQAMAEMWWGSLWLTKETLDKSMFALSLKEFEGDLIDACVPLSKFQEFYDYYWKLKEEYGWDKRLYGAALIAMPRGPIPFGLYLGAPVDTRSKKDLQNWFDFKEKMYKYALSLGGTLSGVNGVGQRTSAWIRDELGPAFNVLEQIKRVLDPNNILNRGNRGFKGESS